ncbi:MAG: ECF-type sigma factor [Rudaea sp.]
MNAGDESITASIARWRCGDAAAAISLNVVHGVRHAIDPRWIADPRAASLVAEKPVLEAFIKRDSGVPDARERRHLHAIATRATRRMPIDRGCAHRAAWRYVEQVADSVVDVVDVVDADGQVDLVVPDRAPRLEQQIPRNSRAIELRRFASFQLDDAAELLGVSRAMLSLDWRTAQVWLRGALAPPATT